MLTYDEAKQIMDTTLNEKGIRLDLTENQKRVIYGLSVKIASVILNKISRELRGYKNATIQG